MLRKLLSIVLSIISLQSFAQKNINIPLASDFTIITSNHDTLNLYKTLSEGKTVVLDLFQISCGSCITNSPIIDSAFNLLNNNNVVFWGISNTDSNNTINQFKSAYNIDFPCAGIEGGGNSLVNMLQNQMGSFGFPTYAVICPTEKTMHFQVNNPPTIHGFDTYINNCNSTGIVQKSTSGDKIVQIFPNPATDYINIKINNDEIANFRVELLSNMGEKLRSQTYASTQSEVNQFILKLDGIKEGNYYLTIYQDGNLIYAGLVMKMNIK